MSFNAKRWFFFMILISIFSFIIVNYNKRNHDIRTPKSANLVLKHYIREVF